MKSVVIFAFLVSLAFGTTYYVAKTGNDGNSGTEEYPWLTIGKAKYIAVAGDTVRVKAGTYVENLSYGNPYCAGVVFLSHDGWNTIINGQVTFNSSNGITLDGFRVMWSVKGMFITAIKTSADSLTIRNCLIEMEVPNSYSGHGIQGGGDWLTIDGNTIRGFGNRSGLDHGIYASGDHVAITDNHISSNKGYNIHVVNEGGDYSCDSCVIAYNICEDALSGGGIIFAGNYNVVHHNICVDNYGYGIRIYGFANNQSAHDNDVFNNTVVNNSGYGIFIEPWNAVANNTVRNNIFYGNAAHINLDNAVTTIDFNCFYPDGSSAFRWYDGGWYTGDFAAYRAATGQDANSLCENPFLVDTAAHNFRLTEDSPCIDAGDPHTPRGLDLDGYNTPHGRCVDMGAYEWRRNLKATAPNLKTR